jgi:hypothetical protein
MTENKTTEQTLPEYCFPKPVKWTIMVYLAGDNNLSANSISILQELEAAAKSPDVRVLACYDSNSPLPKGARYLEIQHGRYKPKPKPKPEWDWGLHDDMAYPDGHFVFSPDFCNPEQSRDYISEPTAREGLSRFLAWALARHPAHRYMLILFGHGVLVGGNTFLYDTTPPSFLRLKDFARIIKTHFGTSKDADYGRCKPRLDILACDNCIMNGIETAYELKDHVDFTIGSQDLMLAVGWPFTRIVNIVRQHSGDDPKLIARRILKACARRLLDYSLMDRSTEQSVCNLARLRNNEANDASYLVNSIKYLANAMKDGLKTDNCGHICYAEIRDAVRLARLEAQSYWDETFVDLYDFCELLLWKCNESIRRHVWWFKQFKTKFPLRRDVSENEIRTWFVNTYEGQIYERIAEACRRVLTQFTPGGEQKNGVVPYSYYICPDLQYSHGLSIYFPWTLPVDPVIFDPKTYPPEEYDIKTSFDEYKEYDFAGPGGADWASFLVQFFRATLRNVRLVDFYYTTSSQGKAIREKQFSEDFVRGEADLQKSSPDTGEQDEGPRFKIKNYPRRFYLSPEDCAHKDKDKPCVTKPTPQCANPYFGTPPDVYKRHQPSYLGWEIRGILREVITPGDEANYPKDPADLENAPEKLDTEQKQ